jgi:hypothetical protein
MVVTNHNTHIESVTIAIYHWQTSSKILIALIFPHIPNGSKLTNVIHTIFIADNIQIE